MDLLNFTHVFITDIGSTTTKGLLLKKEGSKFSFFYQADASTTVEKPHENVNIGILNVVKQLEKLSGIQIYKNDEFIIPYITTSSAAGGLQIMVMGLTKHDTAKNAELTALGAGGVILRTFAVNDGLRDIEKINIINNLDPDMVLLAGGYNNNSFTNILGLANILAISDIKSRFEQEEKIPLVYCGNSEAGNYIKAFLDPSLAVSITKNIRPSMEKFNFKPAKFKINEIFKNDVMKRAPGFKILSKKVSSAVAVTPTAVERMINIYSQDTNENIIVVDMGGATTDIYSYIKGKYHRTVAANIGLSFSLGNIFATILEADSLDFIMRYIPKGVEADFVKNYIYNKTVNPSYIPQTKTEKIIEKVIAALGINLAVKQHLETNFNNIKYDFWNKYEQIKAITKSFFSNITHPSYKENVYKFYDNDSFCYSDIDKIIGSGGAISFADSKYEQIQLLIEGFMPSGITTISVDAPFKISHMGLFSYYDKENALKMFKEDCVRDLALVIAPTGKIRKDKTAIICVNKDTNEKTVLKGGTVTFIENGGHFIIKTVSNLRIDKNKTESEIHTKLPIVFDLRGREDFFNNIPLEMTDCSIFTNSLNEISSKILKSKNNFKKGSFDFERKFPYKGIVNVDKGDIIKPDEIFGFCKYRLPKYSFLDFKRFFIDIKDFNEDVLRENILVEVGDKIKENQDIYNGYRQKEIVLDALNLKTKTVTEPFIFKSPINGIVGYMDFRNGIIKIEEEITEENKSIIINVAEKLKIKPRKIGSYLLDKKGDFIQKNAIIAKRVNIGLTTNGFYVCKTPISGFLSEINTKDGTVVIKNEEIKDIPYHSIYLGRVKTTTSKSIKITSNGIKILGIMGYGSESYGVLRKIDDYKKLPNIEGSVLYSNTKVSYEELQDILKLPLKGLILPSIEANAISKIIGKEIGVAITGDENLKFPIIILHGFGDINLSDEISDIFLKKEEQIISLNGRTHVRAGILRPFVMLYEKNEI